MFASATLSGSKPEQYAQLLDQARGLLHGEHDRIANAANLSALVYHALPDLNWVGFYFYDGRAPEFAAALKPSPRGELEITDLNRRYLEDGSLHLEKMGRGYAWLDTGTHESLLQAGNFIETIEQRQGLRVCCPEEIAYLNGWIDAAQLEALARPLAKNGYVQYLLSLLEHGLAR